MANLIPEEQLKAIEKVVALYKHGANTRSIAGHLETTLSKRTLQYRLKYLVNVGRLEQRGKNKGVLYYLPTPENNQIKLFDESSSLLLSDKNKYIQKIIRQPLELKKPVGYSKDFLHSYRPNTTFYLSEEQRNHLRSVGTVIETHQPAGTFARQLINRLLIDLSWNSSRLEGNTYSLLDTKRLIHFGEEANGKQKLETQMILNHKEAIEFLVEDAENIGFNRYTLLNLHALLANNLLSDPSATGRLRTIIVGIENSAFHPLEIPQLIEECFDQILISANTIHDPFEQAFFALVHIPYLQPFDDVNKRVSRLAANIPLIKNNLIPLAFTDLPTKIYIESMLAIYELNNIELLKEVFIWAYERSAQRYQAVRQSLGEPDSFRLKHRDSLKQIIQMIIRQQMDKHTAFEFITQKAKELLSIEDQEHFREMIETELLSLHEGNFARYQIMPSEFNKWKDIWNSK